MAGPINPYDAPEPERRGMSGTTKVLIGLGVGCGLILVLCCGVLGIGGVWLANFAQQSLSTDAAKVGDVTKNIVTIEIPDSLQPEAAFDMHMPFTGEPLMTWVSYMSDSHKSHLLLGQFGPPLANAGDFEEQLKRSIRQSGRERHEDLDVQESETYDAKINDEDARFRISKGLGERSKKELWEVIGHFHGNGGPAMLILRLESPEFSKEQILDILKSMK